MCINIQVLQYMPTNTFVDGEEVVAFVLGDIADRLKIHLPSICKAIREFGGGSETKNFLPGNTDITKTCTFLLDCKICLHTVINY